jgi:hypothetical protein
LAPIDTGMQTRETDTPFEAMNPASRTS